MDGTRVFLFKEEGSNHALATKHNGVYTKSHYPALFAEIEKLNLPFHTILDGEFVKRKETLYLPSEKALCATQADTERSGRKDPALHPDVLMSQVRVWFDYFLSQGFEGTVVKDPLSR